jgi:hypothetical protein
MMHPSKHERYFNRFLSKAQHAGFSILPSHMIARDRKRLRLQPPDTDRISETDKQVMLFKEVDGYQIRLQTTYDPNLKCFTKTGQIWLLIISLHEEEKTGKGRLFQESFLRTGDFLGRALLLAEFFWDRLLHRPATSYGTLMRLHEFKKPKFAPCEWQSGDGIERFPFFKNVPERFRKLAVRWRRYSVYYEQKIRVRKGYKGRTRESRKTWRKGKHKKHPTR